MSKQLPLVSPLIYPTATFNEETGHWEATSPTAPGRVRIGKSGRTAKLGLWAEMVDEMEDAVFDEMEN